MISKCPAYDDIIGRLQGGECLLDVGCFLGQDLRRLVADGAPSDRLYAVDIVNHWDLGYEMFRDRHAFTAHYIEADILYPNAALSALRGSVNIISITHVLHQWEWDDQVKALEQLTRLTNPGAMVIGFQVGSVGVKERPATGLAKSAAYWHDPLSFQTIWGQVGRQTGTSWSCVAELKTWEEIGWNPRDTEYLGEDARIIQWTANRFS